jgi:serine/threonine protein kinase
MNSAFETVYAKLERIGKGTFGKVYRCRRRSDGAFFAVKEIDIENESILHQVLKEITIMEKTQDSPYMIKYIQHFEMKDTILIVMELADDGNLYEYLLK